MDRYVRYVNTVNVVLFTKNTIKNDHCAIQLTVQGIWSLNETYVDNHQTEIT